MNSMTTMFLAAAVLVGTSGAACKKSMDKAELEGKVRETAKGLQLELKTVTCPAEFAVTAGTTVTCDATDDAGTAGKVNVAFTDGGFKMTVPSAVVQTKLNGHASEAFSKLTGKKVTVSCPPKTIFSVPGKAFKCDAAVEGVDVKHTAEFVPSEKDIDMKLTAVGSTAVVAEQHEPAGADAPDSL